MQLVKDKISVEELKKMSEKMFGDSVKAVVDIDQRVMVIDAAFHVDEEAMLLDAGSMQDNLWGINLYPANFTNEHWIDFDSMINIRPSSGNKSRSVEDMPLRKKIVAVVATLVSQ